MITNEYGIGVICGACGHEDDMDLFIVDSFGHPLPYSQFQCPECGVAVERILEGERTFEPVKIQVIGHHFMRVN